MPHPVHSNGDTIVSKTHSLPSESCPRRWLIKHGSAVKGDEGWDREAHRRPLT